jgi:hypothetical protein
MKRFNELTVTQKDEAVKVAKEELLNLLEQGVVQFDRPASDAVVTDYAVAAAEDAWYSEPSDRIIDGIADDT